MASKKNKSRGRILCNTPAWITGLPFGSRKMQAIVQSYSRNGLSARTDFSVNPGSFVTIRVGYELIISEDGNPPAGLPSIVSAVAKSCRMKDDLICPTYEIEFEYLFSDY